MDVFLYLGFARSRGLEEDSRSFLGFVFRLFFRFGFVGCLFLVGR